MRHHEFLASRSLEDSLGSFRLQTSWVAPARWLLRAVVMSALAATGASIAGPSTKESPRVIWVKPADQAREVSVRPTLQVAFAAPMNPASLTATSVTLLGSAGVVQVNMSVDRAGRLVQMQPVNDLTPSSSYTLFIRGAEDLQGRKLPLVATGFTTKALAAGTHGPRLPSEATRLGQAAASNSQSSSTPDAEMWIPGAAQARGAWTYTGARAYDRTSNSRWARAIQPLQAAQGVTAISGHVSRVNGKPLANVSVSIGATQATTDSEGRFLLIGLQDGPHLLTVDASSVGPGKSNYGVYQVRVAAAAGQTTVLPEPFWLNKLDPRGTVNLPSPTVGETVVRSPAIPGLELRIPAGTVIRDRKGDIVTQVNITPIPVDRPPFPLPGFDVPVYFTIQPGGAWIQGVASGSAKGARLLYPNKANELGGALASFWNYDPSEKEWYIYGVGRVSNDRRQVVPDPEVVLYQFSGAMINSGLTPPGVGPRAACGVGGSGPAPGASPEGDGDGSGPPNGAPTPPKGPSGGNDRSNCAGDPVDAGTGLYVHENGDLFLPDTWALNLLRTYRQGDSNSRPFGVGMTHPFEMFLWSANQYQEVDLVLPAGGRAHYVRTSPGTGFTDAEFETTSSPGRFHKSTIKWNGNGWDLKLKDGTVYVYGDTHPLQSMRDRYGNTVRFTRTSKDARGIFGNITQITGPNGRFIRFTYDASDRITSAQDNLGRTVAYTYDSYGRLTTITNPAGGVTAYGWGTCTGSQASCTWLTSVTDARGNVRLTNTFDTNGRVQQQTLAGGGTYTFTYTLSGGAVIQTDVTNPRGDMTRKTFSNGYVASTVRALGQPEQRTTTIARNASTNQVTSITDQLGRVTAYGRDALGNVTSITRLQGTPQATTTTYTYEPQFNLVSSVVDPLGHTSTFTYDAKGNLLATTDALSHTTTMSYTDSGLLKSVVDPLGHTTTFAYEGADLVSMTDALGRTASRFVDAVGRVSAAQDAAGNRWSFTYDALGRQTQVTDPLGNTSVSAYDPNGNLISFSDPRGGTITWAYDSLNRAVTRTDALGQNGSYTYDSAGNLTRTVDRKGQVTGYAYDLLNRLTSVGFGATVSSPTAYTSTITYTLDGGDRITQLADSSNGTILRSYDGLDQLVSESTPEGTVTYAYDAASRRVQMTAPAQATITYAFDAGDRVTSIARASQTVTFTYDNANRRTGVSYPGTVTATYSFDAADQLTSIAYASGGTALGDLTYTYDAAGRRIGQGGTFARVNLSASISGASYDAGNRLTSWNGSTVTHDQNGNMTAALGDAFTWNARNELASTSGTMTATFAYDADGRRRSSTVNGAVLRFLYDGIQPIQERDASNAVTATLLTAGVDEIFQRTSGGSDQIFLTDALGSPVRLVSGSAVKLVDYTYEPYGEASNDNAAIDNSFQFTGRERNGKLQYNRARYYHPGLARFISEDPIGIAGGPNLFSYALAQPTRFTDSTGLDTQFSAGASGSLMIPFTPFGVPAAGGSTGLSFGISTDGTFSGTSFFAQGQFNAFGGVGAYAGANANAGMSTTDGPLPSGSSKSGYMEANAGWGGAVGMSVGLDDCGRISSGAGSLPVRVMPGRGYGAMFGVGQSWAYTGVSPTIGAMFSAAREFFSK